MTQRTVRVMNRAGLHTRPAAMLVKLAATFASDVHLVKDGFHINAKSIIGVMTLAAEHGSELQLEVDGVDEQSAADAIAGLFSSGFGEQ
ncbi:MAG: HPr family phosphocarrier protein [Candidatus Kapabacteria bacterium]|nr:HPr family phosphocarrier protein [Candidatus Kapabacteria bacterium]